MTTVVEAQFLAAVTPGGAFLPPTLPEVAFAGRSNVGKSSLINTLTGRKSLARTSSTPGCTRSINFFHIRAADGLNFQLVDLPGYGYAKRSKAERAAWGPLLERYLLERAPLRAVILLVDVRRGLEQEEEDLLEFMRQPGHATRPQPGIVLVATKIDKLPLSQRQSALAKLKRTGVGAIGFSSVTGDGVEALWKRLRFHLLGGDELAATPDHAQAAQNDVRADRAASPTPEAIGPEEGAADAAAGLHEGVEASPGAGQPREGQALPGAGQPHEGEASPRSAGQPREGDASAGRSRQERDPRGAAERQAAARPAERKGSSRPAGRSKSRSGVPRPANRHQVRSASSPPAERREVRSASPPPVERHEPRNASSGGASRAPSSPQGRPDAPQPAKKGPGSPQKAGAAQGRAASNQSRKSPR